MYFYYSIHEFYDLYLGGGVYSQLYSYVPVPN